MYTYSATCILMYTVYIYTYIHLKNTSGTVRVYLGFICNLKYDTSYLQVSVGGCNPPLKYVSSWGP